MERVKKMSEKYPIFRQLENATHGQVKEEYSFAAALVVLFFVLFSKALASPLTNIFALLLISGAGTSMIVSKATLEAGKVKHVISYMLTFAIFTTIDTIVPFIHRKVPFYYHGKLIFFYYLSSRRSQFTEYLNNNVYAPASDVLRRVNEVDAKDKIKTAETEASKKVKDMAKNIKEVHAPKEE